MNFIINILTLVNTFIFIVLSAIHVYWAFGGRWYSDRVIPEKLGGEKEFNPGLVATLFVAIGLLFFALITINCYSQWIELSYSKYGLGFITIVFYLRALGDFKYVGVTKRIKGTLFAQYDSKFYSPLSFYLGSSSLFILLFQNL